MLRRRPRVPFAHWGHDIREFALDREGVVRFAQWRHPRVSQQLILQEEIDGLRQFIRPGDFAIDVGAHTGDTTVPMALAASPSGCVLALEPNPHVFKVLEVNAALNPAAARIVPECVAATEDDGAYVFHYGDASFCNGGQPGRWRRSPFRRRYPLSVVGRNLLRLLRSEYADHLPRLSYVKVDAEGHDRAILESILPILRQRRPVIRTEVFRKLKRYDRHVLYELLTGNGYEVFRYQAGPNPQGARLHRDQMTAEKHFDVVAIPKHKSEPLAA
jgi:FkbM family methyltransferase